METIDPAGHSTSQSYDSAGMESRTDGRSQTTSYSYNEYNCLTSVKNARGETTTYSYDLNGNLLIQTDGKGNITTMEYNAGNKVAKG